MILVWGMMALLVMLVTDSVSPLFLMYDQLSMQQRLSTSEDTVVMEIATGMIDEQVKIVWEVDVFLGREDPPQGYKVFRLANGRDYSGYLRDGVPNGYGVMRGPIVSYIGSWEDGIMVQGIMVDAVRGTEFRIPWVPIPPTHQGSPDPQ